MKAVRSDLRKLIQERVAGSLSHTVWTPADFLDLAGREAIDKTLQRLVTSSDLRRIDRGLYDRPTFNKLTKQENPPNPRGVIDAIVRRDQVRILIDGMTAANDLGFTTAVPARIVVHTDARLKPIKLGALSIAFRPTAPSKLYWANRPAMRIVQAIHWMRDILGSDEEKKAIQRRLKRLLSDPDQGERLRTDLVEGLPALPAWMQALLKPMLRPPPVKTQKPTRTLRPRRASTRKQRLDEPHL